MDYLYQRNRAVRAQEGRPTRDRAEQVISAAGKHVVVIGGGDTGMDCISNANREGARDAQMLDVYPELRPSGPRRDARRGRWPPKRTPTTYALDEGGERGWNDRGDRLRRRGRARHDACTRRRSTGTSSRDLHPVPGQRVRAADADLVLIAIGFSRPEHAGPVEQLELEHRPRAATSNAPDLRARRSPGVFACGDARVGQSLVVTAIAEGRKCARIVNKDLGGSPMDADREQLAIGAWSGVEDHTLRHEAEAAGSVRLGDDFFSGPGGPMKAHPRKSPHRARTRARNLVRSRAGDTAICGFARYPEAVGRIASCSAGIVSPTIPGCGGPGWIRALPRVTGVKLCAR